MTIQDFTQHNEEVSAVWAAYHAGNPIRVPVLMDTDTRFFILENDDLNPNEQITFEDYSEDALLMLDFQLRAAAWRAQHIAPYCDERAGLPDKFTVTVDLQRYFEAGFFGAAVIYKRGQTPDTRPILAGEHKHRLFDQGLPDPLTGGVFAKAHRLYAIMAERLHGGFTYQERPVEFAPFGLITDGPLTVATNLRGVELYTDFYEDPDYVRQLLDLIVEATIARVRAHRRFFGQPEIAESWSFADDAVQLLSTTMVRDFVLPAHHKLKAALTSAPRIAIHLCGDATRHFKLLRDELGVYSFDTGFPIDFTWLRQELGPAVEIKGGPRVTLLREGTPEQITTEVRRILMSGIMEGGRFILREANDMAPGTPIANIAAAYEATRTFGHYAG
ncbi:MAG: hypothetical protein DYG89_09695 [Caldilinea sp. CFX5]|nr:hypothetical protein [Caldilinea sp. CFX5]